MSQSLVNGEVYANGSIIIIQSVLMSESTM